MIKADGLAAGKGVVIAARPRRRPRRPSTTRFGGRFGAAGARVVIEEFLEGEIGSLFALCDGKTSMLFGWAQDHKRAFDGDAGPEHRRHGDLFAGAGLHARRWSSRSRTRLVEPAFTGIAADGAPYRGVLFVELMADRARPQAGGVQRPLRRPGVPGADAAAGERPRPLSDGLRHRPAARDARAGLARRGRGLRGDGGRGLSRRAPRPAA